MIFLKVNSNCELHVLTLECREGLLNIGQTDNMGLQPKPSVRFFMGSNPIVKHVSTYMKHIIKSAVS